MSEAVSATEQVLDTGNAVKVLDVFRLRLLEPKPKHHQQENHLLDPDMQWTYVGRATWPQVRDAADSVNGPLWINGTSSYRGTNNQVPEADLPTLTRSLYLVKPENLRMWVGTGFTGKREDYVLFRLSGHDYGLKVTDSWVLQQYDTKGVFAIPEAVLCISLTPAWQGYGYKLAAAVITPERAAT